MRSEHRKLESLAATEALAREIALNLVPPIMIALDGDLGSGKTTFTRALVSALGGDTDVSSPTYVLCNEYTLADGRTAEHWDLYRTNQIPLELLEDANPLSIRIIEWASRYQELIARCNVMLSFSTEGETARSVQIQL